MVHGRVEQARGGVACPARVQRATVLVHPARLDEGLALLAALRVLKPHGWDEWGSGGWGKTVARHHSPTFSSTGAWCPCRPP